MTKRKSCHIYLKEVLRFIKQTNQEVNKSMGNKQDFSAEKQSLKDKLMAIILLETAKDYKEMDSDLVTECVDFLMELERKQKLTKVEIKQKVNEIPFKGKVTAISSYAKKKTKAKRIFVVAAIFAVLLTIFSILVISFTNAEDSLVDRFANYFGEEAKPGERMEIENIELIKPNEVKSYSSIEALIRDENIAILFPTWLPENNHIRLFQYVVEDLCGRYYILSSENPEYCVNIYLDMMIPEEAKVSTPTKEIGNHTVYIIMRDSYVQGELEYNGYHYSVSANSEEDLIKIIENLKEIK